MGTVDEAQSGHILPSNNSNNSKDISNTSNSSSDNLFGSLGSCL